MGSTTSVSDIQLMYCQVITLISVLCSIVLVTTWCMMPRWRTLQNYISVHQITTGTLHLCAYFFIVDVTDKFGEYLLFLSLCWSLCGQLHAYAQLVLLLPGSRDENRRWALLLSYGTLVVVKCITDVVVPYLCSVEYFSISIFHQGPRILSETIVITINVLLYVIIADALLSGRCAASAGSAAAVRARRRRLAGLIGVTILSDVVAGLYLVADFVSFHIIVQDSDFAFEVYKILKMTAASRLVVQTVVVLFNVRSRAEIARYFQLRRNRRLNRL